MKLFILSFIFFLLNTSPIKQPQVPGRGHLYAPWRASYIHGYDKPNNSLEKFECPFCEQLKENNDKKNFILKRLNHCFVMLNLYPYNAGHMMIIPYRHIPKLANLTRSESNEIMDIIIICSKIIEKTMKPTGLNAGLNIGRTAGASLPGHLHFQVLPRFDGDSGFIEVLANTQVISNLPSIYEKLKKAFDEYFTTDKKIITHPTLDVHLCSKP